MYKLLKNREEANGKTIEKINGTFGYETILFTDGTALLFKAVYESENLDIELIPKVQMGEYPLNILGEYPLNILGIMSKEEYDKEWNKFLDETQKRNKEDHRKQYEELKKEFGGENAQ